MTPYRIQGIALGHWGLALRIVRERTPSGRAFADQLGPLSVAASLPPPRISFDSPRDPAVCRDCGQRYFAIAGFLSTCDCP